MSKFPDRYPHGWLVVTGLIVISFLTSCNTTKYLRPDESLLTKTKIIFKNEKNVSDRKTLEKDLLAFVDQKPNEKLFFFIPKEYIYLANSQEGKNGFFNKILKGIGDPPVIYSDSMSNSVVAKMENYLRFKKGYYDAKVDFFVEEKRSIHGWQNSYENIVWEKNVSEVSYIISPGQRWKVKDVRYESDDKELLSFIQPLTSNAYVKKGNYIDFDQFDQENRRVTLELQNNGYVNFSNSYIEIVGDSSRVNKDIDVTFQIRTPLPDTAHARYTTGNIKVYTDYYKDQEMDQLKQDTISGFNFFRQSDKYLVKPSLLKNSIFFQNGTLVSRDDRQKTYRKLNSLGTYRFVNIIPVGSNIEDSIMNFDIQLTPFQKKWVFDGGIQTYYSTLGAARLLGFSLSSQFLNRNFLGGSEKYSLRAEAGTELGFSTDGGFVQRTTNLSIQNILNIPSFQDFIGLGRLAWRTGIIKDKFYKNFVEEASTNIALGFSAINIIDFYSLSSFNASFGFDYTSPANNRYVFKPLGFNLDQYQIKDTSRFEQNPLILLSFKDILGTGFIFRDFSFIYNKAKNRKGISIIAINNLELSGWEVHFSNLLYNAISGSNKEWVINTTRQISFAKYVRYEFDGRLNKEYSSTRSLATRFNFGVVVSFGENAAVPFIRQFGVGGPNSLRAWNIKEPGPGGYRDPSSKIRETPVIFVNQGDIKIELNAEYRFNIVSLFDGALFADVGNVWTLKDDPNRPGAAFSSRFYDQLAVGIGYGLRFNFDFFIIRFDSGYKVRSPFADPYKKTQWYSLKEIRQQGIGNIQVAVNYPF
ncbi:MAG: hypothetical protein WBO36_00690 [Saprospiraceae bacterium]